MEDIDAGRPVYLFLHGRSDLEEGACAALAAAGFDRAKITRAAPDRTGEPGDYMAMLWRPPSPDHIKIQRITEVRDADPGGMEGLWKGVSRDDLFTVRL